MSCKEFDVNGSSCIHTTLVAQYRHLAQDPIDKSGTHADCMLHGFYCSKTFCWCRQFRLRRLGTFSLST